jgi:hypothetical protein
MAVMILLLTLAWVRKALPARSVSCHRFEPFLPFSHLRQQQRPHLINRNCNINSGKSRRGRQAHGEIKAGRGDACGGTLRGFLLGLAALVALALLKILIGTFSAVALIAPDRMTFLAAI